MPQTGNRARDPKSRASGAVRTEEFCTRGATLPGDPNPLNFGRIEMLVRSARDKRSGRDDEKCQSRLDGIMRFVDRDFWLDDDQRRLRDLVRQVAAERIAPHAADVDETESYPAEQLEVLGEQGVLGLWVPEAWGGANLGVLAFCLAVEEIARGCASTGVIFLVQFAAGYPIAAYGSDDQKRRYLPRLASGEITTAFFVVGGGRGL
jgi:acyl-CoA dehydrogenase-like protein